MFVPSNVRIASVVALVATLGSLIVQRQRRHWNQKTATIESFLRLDFSSETPTTDTNSQTQQKRQTWEDLPPVVQRYLKTALPAMDEETKPRTILHSNFRQNGEFFLKGKWVPFTATQMIGAAPRNPGFIWDAKVFLTPNRWREWLPTFYVRDAWFQGQGELSAHFMGVFPVTSEPRDEEQKKMLLVGEMMRWLAEALLVPTALLPNQGLVTWNAIPDEASKVKLSMTDSVSGVNVSMEVTFDESGDSIRVDALRPFADGGAFVMKPWVGFCSDFRTEKHDLRIPMHMEAGWVLDRDDNMEYYFRADNMDMSFAFAAS